MSNEEGHYYFFITTIKRKWKKNIALIQESMKLRQIEMIGQWIQKKIKWLIIFSLLKNLKQLVIN